MGPGEEQGRDPHQRSRAPRPSWVRVPATDAPTETLIEWLTQRFPHVGAKAWSSRFARGRVIDEAGLPLRADAPCSPGALVGYFREVAEEPQPERELRILHLDDRLVAVDKPPFVPVVPSGPWVRRCLLYRLQEQVGDSGLSPVHRLDRATAGVVLFTRRPEDRAAYAGLFAAAEVSRLYLARAAVPDRPDRTTWLVESRIEPGRPFFRMREANGPANARTRIRLLSWAHGEGVFALRPATGKKHQLRLHMSRLGWPIAADRLYPDLLPEEPDDPAAPLRLVARRLTFVDPLSGHRQRFESAFEV